ncbi:Ig domain-containing protein [Halobacteriovorax sp. XZX-3]|uniref:Ig domain-containing protein n=1 Tax=unclassified Halobacteriovorax TaxID=2639665 RepID=UPI00371B41B8
MKTLKGKPSLHLILILLLIATSCVPDSLTKFKEDGASSDDASSAVGEVVDPPSEFVDDNGFPIDPDTITAPSSISYDTSKMYIFVTGDESLINKPSVTPTTVIDPIGNFGDYIIQGEEGAKVISSATQNNFLDPISNPGFNFGTDITTTYASSFSADSKTGTIKALNNSIDPIRAFTLAFANFNYYNPSAATAETLTILSMPKVTVQAPIPESITFTNDQSFNCTGAGIGTLPPASPSIGDVYLSSGTCYYNYDGTNTNTVAFPFTGPVYIGLELASNSGFLTNDAIPTESFMTGSGAQGTIIYKDTSNTIYGTLSSGDLYPNDTIDNAIPFSNTESIIQKVKYFFQPDSNIVLKLINDTSSSPASHISYDNSTKIEISPDLPSTLRLVKDVDSPLFGYIIDTSGGAAHALQEAKEYTVTVSNDLTMRTFKFDIGVINPPENLSYSQMVAFKVKNLVQSTSNFTVGQRVASSVAPPLNDGTEGIIKRILDIDGNEKYLIVQVISGAFQKDASIDNYKTFLDEEAVILTTPISLTHVMELNSTAAFTPNYIETMPAICMEFAAAPSNEFARAIVTGNPTEAGLANYIFVNQIKNPNDINSNRNFVASNTAITDCSLGTNYVLQEIWSPVLKGTFSSVGSLVSGMDILTTSNRASLSLSGINSSDNTALLQSADGLPVTLTLPESFSSVRPYSVNAASLIDYETLSTFELQRGIDANIIATLPKGESVDYSITPDLPPGLNLNPETGIISGKPEVAAASKTYTVSATNILGTSSTSFDILVEDYFEVDLEIDRTPIFHAHKDGEGNLFNKCRIKKRDIMSNPGNLASEVEDIVDIDCFFDVGEGDIYKREMNLAVNVGPGICHTMEYVPFSYFKRRPNKTTEDKLTYNGATSDYIVQVVRDASPECINANTVNFSAGDGNGNPFGGGDASVSTYVSDGNYVNGVYYDAELTTLCTGKYSDEFNCDTGEIQYAEILFIYTPAVLDDMGAVVTPDSCTNTVVKKSVSCGGNPRRCLDGPVVHHFSRDNVINKGTYAESVEAFDGMSKSYIPGDPILKGGDTNVTVTNYFSKMACHDGNTNYYADAIKMHADSADMYNSPNSIVDPLMGAQPFYTFNCLDQADDILARINVHIRDWDTGFELANLDKTYLAGNWGMDNALNDVYGRPVNSITDWDDLNRGSNYSACGLSTAPTIGNTLTALPLTMAEATRSSSGLIITSGVPADHVYVGMELTIGGESYQVKGFDSDEISLTLPIKQASIPAGTTIFGRYLYEFPAGKYNDRDEE